MADFGAKASNTSQNVLLASGKDLSFSSSNYMSKILKFLEVAGTGGSTDFVHGLDFTPICLGFVTTNAIDNTINGGKADNYEVVVDANSTGGTKYYVLFHAAS